jgi:aminoglycoside phosphotransferase (APT) family kinase protein
MNKGRSDDRPRPGLPQRQLHPLLDFLATQAPVDAVQWHQWRLTRLAGGANNLLYRATSDQGQVAVKFTLRDPRDRAGREYHALVALQRAGLDLAPQPVLLERGRYPQPVVVTTWLAGQSADIPPTDDAEWAGLIRHLVTVHALTPAETTVALPPVVLTMASAQDGLARLDDQLRRLPEEARPSALQALADRAAQAPFPAWPQPPVALCRGDPNISNFLRRPGTWASVDWEYSGWGDPAFELADLATHPKYDAVPPQRWDWVIARYCAARSDPTVEMRIRVYAQLLLVWWVARFARLLYEAPRGLDERLVRRPAGWESTARRQYQHYLVRAEAALTEGEPLR